MSKHPKVWCHFCGAAAEFIFDLVPMCDDHTARFQMALELTWCD